MIIRERIQTLFNEHKMTWLEYNLLWDMTIDNNFKLCEIYLDKYLNVEPEGLR